MNKLLKYFGSLFSFRSRIVINVFVKDSDITVNVDDRDYIDILGKQQVVDKNKEK